MNRLKMLRLKLEQFWPGKVPITPEALDEFTTKVLLAAGVPDLPEYRRVIATSMMHLSPVEHRKSIRFFQRTLRRALANQNAFDKIQELVKEAKAKEEANKTTEVTTADGSAQQTTEGPLV